MLERTEDREGSESFNCSEHSFEDIILSLLAIFETGQHCNSMSEDRDFQGMNKLKLSIYKFSKNLYFLS